MIKSFSRLKIINILGVNFFKTLMPNLFISFYDEEYLDFREVYSDCCTCFHQIQVISKLIYKTSGPSCSKNCYFNKVTSGGFVKSYSTYKINCRNIFC